jgi:hypothetical protein
VAAAIVLAFLVGAAVGFVLGRRNPRGAPGSTDAAPALPRTKATTRAKKAGLTDASLTPQDDILERLRKVADGELDPRELEVERLPQLTPEEIAANEERLAAEQRVLDRLRRQAQLGGSGSDLANDLDNDDSR